MNWLSKLLSADNTEVDFKAVLAALAFVSALGMYIAYGVKGLLMIWDMPSSIRDITVALILGGGTGAAATLLNKKMGVSDGVSKVGNSDSNSKPDGAVVHTESSTPEPVAQRPSQD